jgi:hypothetical protein
MNKLGDAQNKHCGIVTSRLGGDGMQRYRERAMFALNIIFALISIYLLALNVAQVEATLDAASILR